MSFRILDKMRQQTTVYWAPLGPDDFGKPRYAEPVELRVRWETADEEVIEAHGRDWKSAAKVYTGEDVEISGYFWLGTLASLPSAIPSEIVGAYEIKKFHKTPTLRGDKFLRVAQLAKR